MTLSLQRMARSVLLIAAYPERVIRPPEGFFPRATSTKLSRLPTKQRKGYRLDLVTIYHQGTSHHLPTASTHYIFELLCGNRLFHAHCSDGSKLFSYPHLLGVNIVSTTATLYFDAITSEFSLTPFTRPATPILNVHTFLLFII